jgi:hypothetical protein
MYVFRRLTNNARSILRVSTQKRLSILSNSESKDGHACIFLLFYVVKSLYKTQLQI